jgi:hypothetical protein
MTDIIAQSNAFAICPAASKSAAVLANDSELHTPSEPVSWIQASKILWDADAATKMFCSCS